MNQAQKETLEKVIQNAKSDTSIIGLILVGSLAQGSETDKSDIDLFVVVNDERFEIERGKKNYFWGTNFDSNEYLVEIDGKLIPKDFLRKVWIDGNESIINTLEYSKLLYSCDNEIKELLKPRTCRNGSDTIRKFFSMMKSARYTADDDLGNTLLLNKCIFDVVFYACRLVLAHNNILYPCVKNLRKSLLKCPYVPERFLELMDVVLRTNKYEDMVAFYDYVELCFSKYQFDNRLRRGYVLENEMFWYFNEKPYQEI
jgi:predicted nucleotidyltransferase